ncbi:MAG: EAL domain-containing protein [Thermoclostridium sp.]|nr:EAL domain-containing protein [Thermoclostridium sp.]
MGFLRFFNREVSNRRRYFIIIISILMYFFLTVLLAILSVGNGYSNNGLLNFLYAYKGVLTQIQMMISVYLVLSLNKQGYFTSIILNVFSLAASFLQIVRSNSSEPVPGFVTYIAIIIILRLIYNYQKQAEEYVSQIDFQKKQLELSEEKLTERANHDSLTKLHNRDYFLHHLDQEIENAALNNKILAVVFIDLDSFKAINDTLGHLVGDEVLIEVANRFTAVPDPHYIAARPGGDEFYVLVKDVSNLSEVENVLRKITRKFKEPFFVHGTEMFLSASAGISIYPADGNSSTELIKNADMAMYEAKSNGKNQYLYCSEIMKNEAAKKMMLTNNLYKALEREELFLHYQPQINVQTHEIIGFEALLRWKHPEYGTISPGIFIPLAEQTGLIKPIGLWVFKTVCEDSMECDSRYGDHIKISINCSVEQLKDINIVNQFASIIQQTGIDPHMIQIEITESVAFSMDSVVLERLIQFKELGFLIAIDDFGKEYSSLSRIRSFPVDLLKIDMEFVHGISSGSPKDKAIVKTIIQMAKNLGAKVLAEGVETKEQFEFLKSENCDEVQGFYFYKGMTVEEARNLFV